MGVYQAYDYAGSWLSTVANQANLYPDSYNNVSTTAALDWYKANGATTSKIVMGVPLYGRAFEETGMSYYMYALFPILTLLHRRPRAHLQRHRPRHGRSGYLQLRDPPSCVLPFLSPYSSSLTPDQLVAGATVYENSTSVASYSYDSSKREFVSYDTPNIAKAKAQYVASNGLAGTMFWELSTDKVGADSLVGTTHGVFGTLDSTQNHIKCVDNFPCCPQSIVLTYLP